MGEAIPAATEPDDLAGAKRDFLWRVKVTSGSRFNASVRLRSRDKIVNVLNAVASVGIIFLSVIPAVVHLSESLSTFILLGTLFVSLVVLVTSLFQYASEDAINAERLHHCALEIAAFGRKLLYCDVKDRATLSEFAAEYDNILSKYPNHSSSDYQKYRNEHAAEFRNHPSRGTGPGGVWGDILARFVARGVIFLVF
ncbi:MAG: SLATT domain-containing protein, partial [Janthinobacterium lividum]